MTFLAGFARRLRSMMMPIILNYMGDSQAAQMFEEIMEVIAPMMEQAQSPIVGLVVNMVQLAMGENEMEMDFKLSDLDLEFIGKIIKVKLIMCICFPVR